MPPKHIELNTVDLLPAEWSSGEPTYIFNPAIIEEGGSFLALYRVVRKDLGRRIAACRLDSAFRPIRGSARPFSDMIDDGQDWYADPRVYKLRGKYYVYWNNGSQETGENEQYLIELDPHLLSPIGAPMRLELSGKRQRIEKNWIFFEQGNEVWAIYSIAPHRVLRVQQWEDNRIVLVDGASTHWNAFRLANHFGLPRGGAQPLHIGDKMYHFCHASQRLADGTVYFAQCYEFDAKPPFAITRFTTSPLPLPNPYGCSFRLPKLNFKVKSVVYPVGNVWLEREGNILLSYGINDEAAFVAQLKFEDVVSRLSAVKSVGPVKSAVQQYIFSVKERLARRFAKPAPVDWATSRF